MKNSLLVIFIILARMFTEPVFGQATVDPLKQTNPYRAAEGQTKWLTRTFELDEGTSKKIYKVFLKYELQKDSVRFTSQEDRLKKTAQGVIMQNIEQELSEILTREQYLKYVEMTDVRRIEKK